MCLCYLVVRFKVLAHRSLILMLSAWTLFTSKNGCRKKFKIQLGIDIMNYVLLKAWDSKLDFPDWMRQGAFVTFKCKKCYFCLNGYAMDIIHFRKKN